MTEVIETKMIDWLNDDKVRSRLESTLCESLSVDEFISQLMIEFQKPEYDLCSIESKYKAMHLCAQFSLLPSIDEVALIPYDTKGPDGEKVLQLKAMPQWQGFRSIMMRHPDVRDVECRLVMTGDEFEFDGTAYAVTHHQYDPFRNREVEDSLDNLRGGYLIITFIDGKKKYHFTSADYIRKCRRCAQSQNVWKSWTTQQCMKTVYRDAFARRVCPIDPNVTKCMDSVLEYEDRMLKNDPRVIDHKPVSTTALTSRIERDARRPALKGPAAKTETVTKSAVTKSSGKEPDPTPAKTGQKQEQPAELSDDQYWDSITEQFANCKSHDQCDALTEKLFGEATESQRKVLSAVSVDRQAALNRELDRIQAEQIAREEAKSGKKELFDKKDVPH